LTFVVFLSLLDKPQMRKQQLYIIFLFFTLGSLSSAEKIEKVTKWTKVKTRNGIEVYSRVNTLSDVKEIRVETTVEASLSAMVYLIKQAEMQPQWVYSSIQSKVIKNYNNFHWVTYMISDAPWPATDRDCVTDVQINQLSDSSVIISSNNIDNFYPKKDDFVRIPFIRASWKFKKLGNNKFTTSFQILILLGGSAPSWVVNLFVDSAPYNSVYNFREELKKPQYKNIKLDFLK